MYKKAIILSLNCTQVGEEWGLRFETISFGEWSWHDLDCLTLEDDSTTFLRNVGNHLPNDTASHPTGPSYSAVLTLRMLGVKHQSLIGTECCRRGDDDDVDDDDDDNQCYFVWTI